tara:strand:+ start:2358 stop:3113 length:756 start_codon:yes stop_codon:yes gene_type:complete
MIFSNKLLKYKNISHCFLGMECASSKGIYKSFNRKKGLSNMKANAIRNLKMACRKISSTHKNLILLNQIHSDKFFFINKRNYKTKLIGDALITNKKNIILGILTADCAPIFIYDPKLKFISAIHAGWRGIYKEIIKKVVKFLVNSGSNPEDLVASIGPCINQKNYEIKSDFKTKFLKKNIKNKIFFKTVKKKTYFSLNRCVNYQLKNLGVKKIDVIDKDTYNPKNFFFSARRAIHNNENDYGRNISLIMIK